MSYISLNINIFPSSYTMSVFSKEGIDQLRDESTELQRFLKIKILCACLFFIKITKHF